MMAATGGASRSGHWARAVATRVLPLPVLFLGSTLLVFALARAHDSGAEPDGGFVAAYSGYLGRLASMDFGVSTRLQPGIPVAELAGNGLALSLGLVGGALLASTLAGFAWAWRASRRPDPTGPGPWGTLLLLASAAPVFVIAYVARDLVNPVVASLAERGLIESPRPYLVGMGAGPVQFVVAALTLGLGDAFLAHLAFTFKDEAAAVRSKDFVHAAWMNGGPVSRHVLRNLAVPVLATLSARLPALLGGAVVVETAYSLNGAGRILWKAAIEGDVDVLMAVTVLLTGLVFAMRLIVEVVTLVLDPRLSR